MIIEDGWLVVFLELFLYIAAISVDQPEEERSLANIAVPDDDQLDRDQFIRHYNNEYYNNNQ